MLEQPEVLDEPREEEGYKTTDPLILEAKLEQLCISYLKEMDTLLNENLIDEAVTFLPPTKIYFNLTLAIENKNRITQQ